MEWILFLYLASGTTIQPPKIVYGFKTQQECVNAGEINKALVPSYYACASRKV